MFSLDKETFKKDFEEKYLEIHGEEFNKDSIYNNYEALGSLVREYITCQWIDTNKKYAKNGVKQVYYFSMEFLLGRLLSNSLLNLGIRDMCKDALKEMGVDLEVLEEIELDQGLGNGGLGRLAACFLDSMASLDIAGHGCGIRYKYGFFQQKIVNGSQVEFPDNWLKERNVWEMRKPESAVKVKFEGKVDVSEENGKLMFNHHDYQEVLAVPYDTPIVGYKNGTVNNLRLWSAEPVDNEFDFTSFSRGDFLKAIEYKNSIESISQVLYPDDTYVEGRILRLKQQYFFVSAGIQSIVKYYKECGNDIRDFHEKIAIHINDTHPALAIPELMRILMDEEGLSWENAWEITVSTISYTNHTILAEALEKWPIDMFSKLLPRIYMIVNEINERFCRELWNKYEGQWQKISNMAIIADGYVKMAHLAIVGSHSVNGVAKLHTEILKKQEMANFYYHFPYKFNNKTNGITHRRWLIQANPKLSNLLTECIGDSWIKHPTDMEKFQNFAYDSNVRDRLYKIKRENKENLADYIKNSTGIIVNPDSLFDSQVKRIHAYKRQILNIFHVIHLYNRLLENPDMDIVPRTFIFAGKAAPAYNLAKKTIKLINTVGEKINNDKRIKDKIKVVFLENYRVSLAEKIIPATELSEQISTTTKEASGTSNMKFMMNGAITIATLDGANIEIRDEVGDDNIVIFGLTARDVLDYYKNGGYYAYEAMDKDERIKKIIHQLKEKHYNLDYSDFEVIHSNLFRFNDEFFVMKDFAAYVEAQNKVNQLYKDKDKWNTMSAINIAHSGIFSSDRTILEYATGIWGSGCLYKNL